jgi:hypothetical protein
LRFPALPAGDAARRFYTLSYDSARLAVTLAAHIRDD